MVDGQPYGREQSEVQLLVLCLFVMLHAKGNTFAKSFGFYSNFLNTTMTFSMRKVVPILMCVPMLNIMLMSILESLQLAASKISCCLSLSLNSTQIKCGPFPARKPLAYAESHHPQSLN